MPHTIPSKNSAAFRNSFLADLSHEVRRPLNAIIGYSELLVDEAFGPLSPQQQEVVNDILGAGRHLLRLANDVLDISKARLGKLSLELETLSVAAVVKQAVDMSAGTNPQKKMLLEYDVPADLAVRADECRVVQVLCNLLGNAIRYSPAGKRVLVTAAAEGSHVRISVIDEGYGMSQADQERVFEDFVAMGRGDDNGGTGLGLAVCQRLVLMMGGEIAVTSEEGKGSTFSFTLRRAEAPTSHS